MREAVFAAAQKYLRFVKPSGENNIGGPCPFHKGGEEVKPSFYINTENGLYFCHTCHAKGTLVQFLKRMGAASEQIDFVLDISRKQEKQRVDPLSLDVDRGEHLLNESLLGVFDFCPKYLVNSGFDRKFLREHEVGFDKRQNRITFPLRDLYGNLIGINGRTVVGDHPRYKVYKSADFLPYAGDPETQSRYSRYDIKNHTFWWNMHNVYPEAFYGDLDTIIIVEGYKAALWLIQAGVDNTIAMQGSRMTRNQERVLSRLRATIILFLDANKAGRDGTYDTGKRLRKYGHEVFVCTYPEELGEGAQPDSIPLDAVTSVLDAAQTFKEWRKNYGLQ